MPKSVGQLVSGVEVVRGGTVESRHRVHLAVCDADGRVIASCGEPSIPTFYRSAAKPMQALPLVEEGVAERLGLSSGELALCCASHEGEPAHVDGARSILEKAGADEGLLQCGAHAPYSVEAARALAQTGGRPERVHNNCSGKHAGMIALAIAMGWDPMDYHRLEHPVQRRMIQEVVRWTGLAEDEIPVGIDGCGVACFAAPLDVMASSFASFAREAAEGASAGQIVHAMTSHPFMVGGTGRTCTDVMEVAGDRVFVKLGAEGVYGGGVPGRGLGFAIKVEDGGRRAVEVALLRVLQGLDVLTGDEMARLRRHANPEVRNTRGEVVGEVRAAFDVPLRPVSEA
jgi:L-asparaginase II